MDLRQILRYNQVLAAVTFFEHLSPLGQNFNNLANAPQYSFRRQKEVPHVHRPLRTVLHNFLVMFSNPV